MKLNEQKLRELVTYRVRIEPESYCDFVGNCSAIDEETDSETEAWIRREIESGNDAAWCMVTVEAMALGVIGFDHLGGCSYESEQMIHDQLVPEMKEEAFRGLVFQIQELVNELFE